MIRFSAEAIPPRKQFVTWMFDESNDEFPLSFKALLEELLPGTCGGSLLSILKAFIFWEYKKKQIATLAFQSGTKTVHSAGGSVQCLSLFGNGAGFTERVPGGSPTMGILNTMMDCDPSTNKKIPGAAVFCEVKQFSICAVLKDVSYCSKQKNC